MACGFCGDSCCNHGVDVEVTTMNAILRSADALEPIVGAPRAQWFTGAEKDADMPGGASVRTRVRDGMCVFRSRSARGCVLHSFALEQGRDYHELKPMVSALFPVTFGDGELLISEELEDGTLVCSSHGSPAYESVRSELAYYFGEELTTEMDRIRSGLTAAGPSATGLI